LSAREDRGHPLAVEAQGLVAYGVDALVDAVQLPFANADRDRLGSKTSGFELLSRHHPVLPCGHSGRPSVWRVEFCVHMDA